MVAVSLYNAPMKYLNHLNEEVKQDFYEHMLSVFLKRCQSLVDDAMRNYSWEQVLSIHKGRRYDKIVKADMHRPDSPSHSVYAFVDKTNGNILKPATWKAPAKHPRGNIYEDDCMQFMGAYGPAYMDKIKSYYGA
tara:strand:+ start:46 stop:450 length:405 start_codon:yes stop_codon:yes gene_type:complete